MKVLLVNTNRMKPPVAPIGLDYLADSVSAAGHEARLLDLCWSTDVHGDIEQAVRAFDPAVIGLSVRNTDDCYYASGEFFLPAVQDVVRCLGTVSDAPVVLGGVGFSVMPEATLDYCGGSYGITGEGERQFVLLLDALASGSGLDRVPGLLRRERGTLVGNPPEEADLALLPARRRAFVDNPAYFRSGGQAGFETKRGCPMECFYCADPVAKGSRTRLRPPSMVAEELSALLDQGIDCFHTCDPELNLPLHHAQEVCRAIIDAGLSQRIRWWAYCAPLPFDEETAMLFRRAGCAGIDFGADSGNARMLERLGRRFSPQDLVSTAAHCRAAGIPFMYDLLLGGPGETRATVRETVDLMRRIGPDCVGVSLGIRVYDGTRLAQEVRRGGPMEKNPALRGRVRGNPRFLEPVFYLSPYLGDDAASHLRELVGGDQRFLLPAGGDAERDYNYNDNELLSKAIASGERGAYWDILRRMRPGA